MFNKEWTTKYFLSEMCSKAICLICKESIVIFKEYNINRHFSTRHANYTSNLSSDERASTATKLAASLQAQQNIFTRQSTIQESCTKASYVLAYKLAKASEPFSKGEFQKECMIETAAFLFLDITSKFKNLSLSQRTVTPCIEIIDDNLASGLNKKAESFVWFLLALDKSHDIKITAQLLILSEGLMNILKLLRNF